MNYLPLVFYHQTSNEVFGIVRDVVEWLVIEVEGAKRDICQRLCVVVPQERRQAR